MVKYVEWTGSDGKKKMATEGSYQQAVKSGKVSAEQHASAKGAKSSSDIYVQSSSSKSSSSSSSKSQEVIPSNTQITFTDIGGKTQTTDYSTYKKWEKAGNVKSSNLNEITDRLTGDSSIGADTVAKLIDEQVRSGQITAEEGAKRKGEAYASEGAIVQATTGYTYKSYSSPNTYVEQQYINPRVQEFLYSGKTTPEAINQEMSKDYVQRTAFVSKYGGSFVGQENLPRRYADEYVYSPLAKFGTDNYSQSQIDLISKAEGEYMGRNDGRYLQLFNIDNNGVVVYNSNLSPSLRAEAERLANKYNIDIGSKLNISSQRPNQSSTTSTSNDQFNNPSDNLSNYENEIYKNDLYKPAGSNVYYEASGDKYVPKYMIGSDGGAQYLEKISDNEIKNSITNVVYKNEEGSLIPSYIIKEYSQEDMMSGFDKIYFKEGYGEYYIEPKGMRRISKNEYLNIETNTVFKTAGDLLIPSYMIKEYDASRQMSGFDKIFFTEKDGEYFIENTTETITSQIPEGFTKVNNGLELPDILKQKMGIKEGILKDLPRPDIYENEGIYYKAQGDKLIPSYTYYNGEKIYASKNKTTGEYEFLISREIKSQTNTERLSEVQNRIKDYKNETGIVRDINNFFDDVALKVVDTTSKYHSNVGKAKDMLLNAKPSGVDKTIYAEGHLGADLFSEVIFSVGEVLVTSPTKIIDTAVRGGYEQQLYKLQDPLSNIKFSSNPIIDLTSKEIIKPHLNLKSIELTEKDYTNFNVPFVNYELKFNKAQLDSLTLGTESSLHALPYVLGGLNALAQISAKTSFTGLTKLTPNIAKQEGLVKTILSNPYGQAGVIGATAGAGIESYQILFDGKEFKPKDFLMTMARSSGSAMGFVAVSDLTSKALVSGWDTVFKVETFTIKNPQLTQVKGDLKADYGFQFQKVQLREPFRSMFNKNKPIPNLNKVDVIINDQVVKFSLPKYHLKELGGNSLNPSSNYVLRKTGEDQLFSLLKQKNTSPSSPSSYISSKPVFQESIYSNIKDGIKNIPKGEITVGGKLVIDFKSKIPITTFEKGKAVTTDFFAKDIYKNKSLLDIVEKTKSGYLNYPLSKTYSSLKIKHTPSPLTMLKTDMGVDLKLYPFESVKMMGVQKLLYKSDVPISYSFTGRNEWSQLKYDGIFSSKHFVIPSAKPHVLIDGEVVKFTSKQPNQFLINKQKVEFSIENYSPLKNIVKTDLLNSKSLYNQFDLKTYFFNNKSIKFSLRDYSSLKSVVYNQPNKWVLKTEIPTLMNKFSNNVKLDIPRLTFSQKPLVIDIGLGKTNILFGSPKTNYFNTNVYSPKNIELVLGSNKYLNIDPLTKYMIQNNKAVYSTTFGKTYYGKELISYNLGESLSYKIGTTQTFYKGVTKNILYDYDVSRSIGQGWSISPDTKLTSGAFLKNAYHSAGESYGFVLTKGTSVQHVMSDVFKSNYFITNIWSFTEPATEYAKIHTFEKTLGRKDSELVFHNKDLAYDFKTGKLGSDSLYSVQEKTIGNQNINKLSASGQQDYTFKTINIDKSKLNTFSNDLIGVKGGNSIDRIVILNKPSYTPPSSVPYGYTSQLNSEPYITFFNPITSINTVKPLFIPLPLNRNIIIEEVVNRRVNEPIFKIREKNINQIREKNIVRDIYPTAQLIKDISRVNEIDKIKDVHKEIYIYKDTEIYIDRYYEETIPIKPIDPIPEIPITFPPYIIGGSPDPDYLRKTQRKKGGILDKRIRLSSISAGTFGTRARPEWRGTSLDTREDVLPARRYNSNQNTGWVTQIQTGIKKAKLVKQPKVKSAKLYKGSRSNTNKK